MNLDMNLNGEVAIVTGAAQGLGEAIARGMAAAGARVAVTDLDVENAGRVAEDLGAQARALHLDVRDRISVEEVFDGVAQHFGPVSILVNNAGINRVGPSETLAEDRWDEVVEVNLNGVFRCTQAAAGYMLEAGRGSIINIASSNSEVGMPGRLAYCTTKTGVVGMTRALAVEWAARGVRVNAIEPGYIRTPMVENALREGLLSEQRILDRIPAVRLGEPEDVAKAAVFLASRAAEYITGRTLAVDGGFLAYGAPAPASELPSTSYSP